MGKKRKAAVSSSSDVLVDAKRPKEQTQQTTLMARVLKPGKYCVVYEASSNESETIYVTDPDFCKFWNQQSRSELLRIDGIDDDDEWDEDVHGQKPVEGSNLWPIQDWCPQRSTCEYHDVRVSFACRPDGEHDGEHDDTAQTMSLDDLRSLANAHDRENCQENDKEAAAKPIPADPLPTAATTTPRCEIVSIGGAGNCKGGCTVTLEKECSFRELFRRLDPENEFGFEYSEPDYETEVSFY
jgi:hypothetical protein